MDLLLDYYGPSWVLGERWLLSSVYLWGTFWVNELIRRVLYGTSSRKYSLLKNNLKKVVLCPGVLPEKKLLKLFSKLI